MADEKETKEEGQKPSKKKLLPLVIVMVGAVLGGAGVVLFTKKEDQKPSPTEVVSRDPIPWAPADVELHFRFNSQTERGKAFGQISFTLSFLVQPGKLEEAKELVSIRLIQARSRCLELLSSQSVPDLRSTEGKTRLKRLLKDELTYNLFPGFKGDRVATVEDIFWTTFLIQ